MDLDVWPKGMEHLGLSDIRNVVNRADQIDASAALVEHRTNRNFAIPDPARISRHFFPADFCAAFNGPAVLFEHGVNDTRVDVWQTTKMASRLAPATTSGRPVLMRLEYDSGHGQGSTREQSQLRAADTWAFFLWQFGDPAFQPK